MSNAPNKNRRSINEIIIHCSASKPSTTRDDIRKWHKQRGWSDIGYHYVIESDGAIKTGRSINKAGAHCKGFNEYSIGICLVGGDDGMKMHKFTAKQKAGLNTLIEGLFMSYGRLPITPHNAYNKHKTCPCVELNEIIREGLLAGPAEED